MPEPLRLDVELGAKGVAAGISEIGRETDGLRVSTQKASTAVRGFVMDLSQARDGADVASAALGAFAKILGTSLAGTAVVIAGKALVDAFLKVSESVKVAKDAVASANAEVAKMGSIRSFEDGARQAQVLSVAAEKAAAEIKKIESSKLQSFLADIRGAKEEMIALADATRKQADEAARAGIVQGAIDLERQKNLSEIDKKIIQSNESYNKLIDAARKLGDVELQNRLIIDQQRTASEIKRDDERKKEAQAQEEWYKRHGAQRPRQLMHKQKPIESLPLKDQRVFPSLLRPSKEPPQRGQRNTKKKWSVLHKEFHHYKQKLRHSKNEETP
jgi:hypothetical protein